MRHVIKTNTVCDDLGVITLSLYEVDVKDHLEFHIVESTKDAWGVHEFLHGWTYNADEARSIYHRALRMLQGIAFRQKAIKKEKPPLQVAFQ